MCRWAVQRSDRPDRPHDRRAAGARVERRRGRSARSSMRGRGDALGRAEGLTAAGRSAANASGGVGPAKPSVASVHATSTAPSSRDGHVAAPPRSRRARWPARSRPPRSATRHADRTGDAERRPRSVRPGDGGRAVARHRPGAAARGARSHGLAGVEDLRTPEARGSRRAHRGAHDVRRGRPPRRRPGVPQATTARPVRVDAAARSRSECPRSGPERLRRGRSAGRDEACRTVDGAASALALRTPR